jgi:hypothetical protein
VIRDAAFCPRCAKAAESHVCAVCRRPIAGRVVRDRSREFCAECFKCRTCSKVLKGDAYIVHHDRYYCPVDGGDFLRECGGCKQRLERTTGLQMWKGRFYHPQCFVCRVCRQRLSPDEPLAIRSVHGRPHCTECFEQRVRDREITPEGKSVSHRHSQRAMVQRRARYAANERTIEQPELLADLIAGRLEGDEEEDESSAPGFDLMAFFRFARHGGDNNVELDSLDEEDESGRASSAGSGRGSRQGSVRGRTGSVRGSGEGSGRGRAGSVRGPGQGSGRQRGSSVRARSPTMRRGTIRGPPPPPVDPDAKPGHRYRHHRHRSARRDDTDDDHRRHHSAVHHKERQRAASVRGSAKLPDMAMREIVARRRSMRKSRGSEVT